MKLPQQRRCDECRYYLDEIKLYGRGTAKCDKLNTPVKPWWTGCVMNEEIPK